MVYYFIATVCLLFFFFNIELLLRFFCVAQSMAANSPVFHFNCALAWIKKTKYTKKRSSRKRSWKNFALNNLFRVFEEIFRQFKPEIGYSHFLWNLHIFVFWFRIPKPNNFFFVFDYTIVYFAWYLDHSALLDDAFYD